MIATSTPSLDRMITPLVSAVLVDVVMLFMPQVLQDGDTYWDIATGHWILTHGQMPDSDVFSYSRPGIPWVAHEWLAEVLMALAMRVAGSSGVVILFAVVAGSATWMLGRRLSLHLGGLSLVTVMLPLGLPRRGRCALMPGQEVGHSGV